MNRLLVIAGLTALIGFITAEAMADDNGERVRFSRPSRSPSPDVHVRFTPPVSQRSHRPACCGIVTESKPDSRSIASFPGPSPRHGTPHQARDRRDRLPVTHRPWDIPPSGFGPPVIFVGPPAMPFWPDSQFGHAARRPIGFDPGVVPQILPGTELYPLSSPRLNIPQPQLNLGQFGRSAVVPTVPNRLIPLPHQSTFRGSAWGPPRHGHRSSRH